MRIIRWILLLASMACGAAPAMDLTMMSFNLRWANPEDGHNVWSNRADLAAEVIERNGVGIAGLQEALASQLADLGERLPDYAWIGVGRDDGRKAGEFSAILYDQGAFEVEKSGTFWLSEKPEKPGSMSWGTACTRIATWGVFRARKTGERLFVLNTHLDHQSKEARERGAKLIADRIPELAGDLPVVVTGDFNAGREAAAIHTLTAGEFGLRHARELAGQPVKATMNGFDDARNGGEIDHILVSPSLRVSDFQVLKEKRDGIFVSDHWPVLARIQLP